MDTGKFYAVVLAGGKGERFWPCSTAAHPKQLLTLVGGKSMLALAIDRLAGLIPPERVLVITNHTLVETSRAAAPGLPPENVIGEPVGRDTAAAVALGTALVKQRDPDAAFCVLTADHIIGDLAVFHRTLLESLRLASKEDVLITMGIRPMEPSTAYGYIEAGDQKAEAGGILFYKARRFVEKPDIERARTYCEAGHFYWNSGMFIWSVRTMEKAFAAHRPPLAAMMQRLASSIGTPGFEEALAAEYGTLEKVSIDYALMEKADNILMVKGAFAWDDVGSWTALLRHLPIDAVGNAVLGACEAIDSSGNIVVSEGGRLTALIGVKDLIIVHADGATLVCPRDKAQDVKRMVSQLKSAGNRYDGVL